MCVFFFFFKQKTAYEMRISDWSSDVCSSDLGLGPAPVVTDAHADLGSHGRPDTEALVADLEILLLKVLERRLRLVVGMARQMDLAVTADDAARLVDQHRGIEAAAGRSEERRVGEECVRMWKSRGSRNH